MAVGRGEQQSGARGVWLFVGRAGRGGLGFRLKRPGMQACGVPRSSCALLEDGGRMGWSRG